MSEMLLKLKKYFQENSREKIESDWEKTKKESPKGPKLKEFLDVTKMFFKWQDEKYFIIKENNDKLATPKYSSEFLF